jgi:hypothetical protein
MVYFDEDEFNAPSNYIIKNDIKPDIIKGGAVKELKKSPEEKEDLQIKRNQAENVSIIPQKPIKGNKISQEKLNRFVNLKLKF